MDGHINEQTNISNREKSHVFDNRGRAVLEVGGTKESLSPVSNQSRSWEARVEEKEQEGFEDFFKKFLQSMKLG